MPLRRAGTVTNTALGTAPALQRATPRRAARCAASGASRSLIAYSGRRRFLLRRLYRFRLANRLGSALDGCQASRRKRVDSGARATGIGQDCNTVAAPVDGKTDVI